MILTGCASRLRGISFAQPFARGIGHRFCLGAQRRPKAFYRPKRRESLSHCIKAANLQSRPHGSRSSHQHLSQRLPPELLDSGALCLGFA
jgi:hypothetical protein